MSATHEALETMTTTPLYTKVAGADLTIKQYSIIRDALEGKFGFRPPSALLDYWFAFRHNGSFMGVWGSL